MKEKLIVNNSDITYYKTTNIVEDTCNIINSAKNYAYQSINIALVKRNWLIGYRIYEEELRGNNRANYGLDIIKNLSRELTKIYGKGFTKTNLYNFLQFYKYFPNIFHACQ